MLARNGFVVAQAHPRPYKAKELKAQLKLEVGEFLARTKLKSQDKRAFVDLLNLLGRHPGYTVCSINALIERREHYTLTRVIYR